MNKITRNDIFKVIANEVSESVINLQNSYDEYLTAWYELGYDHSDKNSVVVTIGVRFNDGVGIETDSIFNTTGIIKDYRENFKSIIDEGLAELMVNFQEQVRSAVEFEEM